MSECKNTMIDTSNNNMSKDTQQSKRQKALIDLIMRQTNYDEEKATIKLVEWDNNYLNVIKEYMNPDFQKKKKEEKKGSKNQMIYGEIRNFMDDVNRQALWRKRQNMKMEKQRAAYIAYMQQQQEKNN